MFVAVIEKDTDTKDWKATATMKLNGHPTTLKLDIGAQCNVISKCSYDQISRRPLQKSSYSCRTQNENMRQGVYNVSTRRNTL